MADFFSNLLLRSSAPTSEAILQPRLPSLFESTHGVDELPTPQADTTVGETSAPSYSPASVKQAANQPASLTDGTPTEMSRSAEQSTQMKPEIIVSTALPENDTPHPRFPATQEKPSPVAQNIQPDPSLRAPDKVVHPLQDELPAHASVTIAQSLGRQMHLEPENRNIISSVVPEKDIPHDTQSTGSLQAQVEPERTVYAPQEQETIFIVAPAAKTDSAPAAQGNESINKQQTASWNLEQQDGRSTEGSHQVLVETSLKSRPAEILKPKTEMSPKSILNVEPAENVFRPLPEPVLSKPVLKPVLPVQPMSTSSKASLMQSEQIQKGETVVQVHIGRIEVRAVTPPAPSQPTHTSTTPARPRMSLDDYLHRREDKG